jgi:hypothetical protein
MTPAPVMSILVGGLIAWRLYRRVRRNIGRQKLRPRRAVTSLVILAIFSALIVGVSFHNPKLLLGFGGGLLPGALLGWVGLRLTRFETTGEGHFYTPSAHIGVALSLLFIGRLAYRFMELRPFSNPSPQPHAIAQSPLTLLILGLLAGYYMVYYAGLLVHSRDQKQALVTGVLRE